MRSVAEYVANLGVVRDQLGRPRRTAECDPVDRGRVAGVAPADRGAQPVRRRRDVLIASPRRDGARGRPTRRRSAAGPSSVTATCSRAAAGSATSRPTATRAVAGARPDPRPTTARLVGIAIAEQTYPIARGAADAAPPPDLVLFLGLGAVLGVRRHATCVSRVVKRRTRGLAPTEIADARRPPRGAAAQHPRGRRRGRHRRPGDHDERRAPGDLLGLPWRPGRAASVADLGLDAARASSCSPATAGRRAATPGRRGPRRRPGAWSFNRARRPRHGRGIGTVTTLRDRTELLVAAERAQLQPRRSPTRCARRPTSSTTSCTRSPGWCSSGSTTRCAALVGTITPPPRRDQRRRHRPHRRPRRRGAADRQGERWPPSAASSLRADRRTSRLPRPGPRRLRRPRPPCSATSSTTRSTRCRRRRRTPRSSVSVTGTRDVVHRAGAPTTVPGVPERAARVDLRARVLDQARRCSAGAGSGCRWCS